MKKKLSRRTMLRGVGITALAVGLPPLEATWSERKAARADAAGSPCRLVLFHFANGAPMMSWTPSTVGAGFAPTEILEGLREGPGRDWTTGVNVLTGLSNAIAGDGTGCGCQSPHEPKALMSTTGVRPAKRSDGRISGPGGPSVDQLAADQLGHSPSLVVAARTRRSSFEGPISFRGVDSSVLPETDPHALFAQLFSDVDADPEAVARAQARRGTILDYLQESIADVRGQVGVSDRRRLDDHLDAIRDLETSLGAIPSAGCVVPPEPGPIGDGDEHLEAQAEALLDLTVMALRCDLRRIVSFSIGPSGAGPHYPFLTMSDGRTVEQAAATITTGGTNDHDISHTNYRADPIALEAYTRITRWKIARFASLLERLASADEGDGTLLDHSAVIGFSELNEGNGHAADFLPVLTAGGLGGMGTGRHLVYPCEGRRDRTGPNALWGADCAAPEGSGDTPLSNLWLTALQAVGVEADAFGDSTGTLADLWL